VAAAQEDLQRQVQQTLERLQRLESQLRATQADIKGLPFLARGFVERDISSSTGRNLAEWIATSNRITQALAPLADGAPAGSAGQVIQSELPRLEALRAYLQKAPEKAKMVPSAMLKPQQRTEFLEQLARQLEELQALEDDLRRVATMLGLNV
jgi:hypothetical protein